MHVATGAPTPFARVLHGLQPHRVSRPSSSPASGPDWLGAPHCAPGSVCPAVTAPPAVGVPPGAVCPSSLLPWAPGTARPRAEWTSVPRQSGLCCGQRSDVRWTPRSIHPRLFSFREASFPHHPASVASTSPPSIAPVGCTPGNTCEWRGQQAGTEALPGAPCELRVRGQQGRDPQTREDRVSGGCDSPCAGRALGATAPQQKPLSPDLPCSPACWLSPSASPFRSQ